MQLDEEMSGDVHFGTANKKWANAGEKTDPNALTVKPTQNYGPSTQKLEKGAMKKAIDLQLKQEGKVKQS